MSDIRKLRENWIDEFAKQMSDRWKEPNTAQPPNEMKLVTDALLEAVEKSKPKGIIGRLIDTTGHYSSSCDCSGCDIVRELLSIADICRNHNLYLVANKIVQ